MYQLWKETCNSLLVTNRRKMNFEEKKTCNLILSNTTKILSNTTKILSNTTKILSNTTKILSNTTEIIFETSKENFNPLPDGKILD